MAEGTARHIVDEHLGDPASYLTIRRGDHVYDLYGWAAGIVVEPRIVATRDEFFDGIVVDFRGRRVFVDAPEVSAIHHGVVLLRLTVGDLARAASEKTAPARRATEAATSDDAVALMGALSRMYAAGRLSLEMLERDVEEVLRAQTCADLDAVANELLAVPTA